MSYIGNSRSLLIVTDNVRDDIIPKFNGIAWETKFELSQEVPGGFEGNVTVLRQKYIKDVIVSGVDHPIISITSDDTSKIATLSCSNASIAAALSVIQPNEHKLIISIDNRTSSVFEGSSAGDKLFDITEVNYNGSNIEIKFSFEVGENTIPGDKITIAYAYESTWEILDPENDYQISGEGDKLNRILDLTEAPTANDKVYVLHRSEGTYKFVPSPKSVGPEQLSENLRNFVIDRWTLLTSQTEFNLSQPAVTAGSLLVTVNGILADSTDEDATTSAPGESPGEYIWSFFKNTDGTTDTSKIKFTSAVPAGAKVRVTHLGFSTVSRRAKFATGQATSVPTNSVDTDNLKNGSVTEPKLAANSVTTQKIVNNAVTGDKILLNNNESLRSKNSSDAATGILKLNGNVTTLQNATEVAVEINNSKTVSVTASAITPETTGSVTLGTSNKKFGDVHTSGNINLDDNKLVDGVDVSKLKALVDQLVGKITSGDVMPVGTIMMWGADALPSTNSTNDWLECLGQTVNILDYPALYAVIGNKFGGDETTFRLPDLINRVPVGSNTTTPTTNNIGANDGITISSSRQMTHLHVGGAHQHGLASHTHTVPGHYHTQNTGAGSTLSISTSGAHTTQIQFPECASGSDVNGVTWNGRTGVRIGTSSPASFRDDGSHGHGTPSAWTTLAYSQDLVNNTYVRASLSHNHGASMSQGGEHGHGAWTTDTNDTSHKHTGKLEGTRPNQYYSVADGIASDDGATYRVGVVPPTDSGHSHTITIGNNSSAGTKESFVGSNDKIDTSNIDHRHNVSVTITNLAITVNGVTQTWPDGTPGTIKYHSDHSHNIYLPELPLFERTEAQGSDQGKHTHAANEFTGSIGNVAGGVSGNIDITTSASTTNSDSAGAVNTTPSLNSPYLVVKFIIKAKNTQITV